MARKTDTKKRLLDAGHTLFWAHGYGSVAIDDICKEAGAQKGSFYHYFTSKADLAIQAMEAVWEQMRPDLDRIFSPGVPAIQRLELYPEVTVGFQKKMHEETGLILGCPFCTIGAEKLADQDGVRAKADQIVNRLVPYFVTALRDAVADGEVECDDVHSTAEKLLVYELGVLMLARLTNNLEPLNSFGSAWKTIAGIKS